MAAQAFFETNQGFRPFNSFYLLNLVMKHFSQMFGVSAVKLDEDTIVTGGVVDGYNFGNFLQALDDLIIQRAFLQVNTDKARNIVPEFGIV